MAEFANLPESPPPAATTAGTNMAVPVAPMAAIKVETGRRVAASATGLFALKIAYSGLGFALGIVLARSLGPAGYGSYAYALSWAVFLGVPAALGLDKYLVRQVAIDSDRHEWSHFKGLLHAANRAGLFASLSLAAVTAVVAFVAMSGARHADERTALLVGLLMVPVLTVMKIRQAALTGLGRIVRGQWPELLLQPALLIAIVLVARFVLRIPLSGASVMGITVGCSVVVHLLGLWLLHASLPDAARRAASTITALPWRASLIPLIAMGTIQILQSQIDTLLLGGLTDARAVGIYSAAYRGAALVTFFLMSAAPALGPSVASLYAANRTDELQRIVVHTARTTFLLSLPVAVLLLVAGRWYLAIFGPAFVEGALPLAILCVGQLVNVACGPVGVVMTMTGHERAAAWAVAAAAAVNAIAGAVLIPRYGMTGAAVGAAAGMVTWNVLLAIEVRRRVGIQGTCFGKLSERSGRAV